MNVYYNYIYLDPRKPGQYCYEGLNFSLLFEPFYVGKGKFGTNGDRKIQHLKKAKYKSSGSCLKYAKIKKIWATIRIDPFIIQINKELSNDESCIIEKHIIKQIGRYDLNIGPLTNMTEGGDGGNTSAIPYRLGKNLKELFGESYIHSKSIMYFMISPSNEVIKVHGRLNHFIKENNLSHSIKNYIDKGKIPHPTKNKNNKPISQAQLNSVGWEIRTS